MRRLVERAACALALLVAAPGCVASRSEAFEPVADGVERRIGIRPRWHEPAATTSAAIAARLAAPLDRDAAVRIALSGNARLQAAYEGLGVSAAALAEATALGPTHVELAYEGGFTGDGGELEVDVLQDVLGLLLLGQRRGVAHAEQRAGRARAIAETVALVARVEVAFYDAVAAGQAHELARTTADAWAAAAELTERQHAAGNVTELALVRQQSAREAAALDLARAAEALAERREALSAALGLPGDAPRWRTIDRLPEPPAAPPPLAALEADALAASLELVAARADEAAADGRVGLARVRTVLPSLAVGVAAHRDDGGGWTAGPAVELGLPLFDWGGGARARAHAEGRRARALQLATAAEVGAAARAARARVATAHAEARRLREVVLPLAARVVTETLKHYNAMDASTYELLQARREQLAHARRHVDAVRRYWSAIAEAEALRRGGRPDRVAGATPTLDTTTTSGGGDGH